MRVGRREFRSSAARPPSYTHSQGLTLPASPTRASAAYSYSPRSIRTLAATSTRSSSPSQRRQHSRPPSHHSDKYQTTLETRSGKAHDRASPRTPPRATPRRNLATVTSSASTNTATANDAFSLYARSMMEQDRTHPAVPPVTAIAGGGGTGLSTLSSSTPNNTNKHHSSSEDSRQESPQPRRASDARDATWEHPTMILSNSSSIRDDISLGTAASTDSFISSLGNSLHLEPYSGDDPSVSGLLENMRLGRHRAVQRSSSVRKEVAHPLHTSPGPSTPKVSNFNMGEMDSGSHKRTISSPHKTKVPMTKHVRASSSRSPSPSRAAQRGAVAVIDSPARHGRHQSRGKHRETEVRIQPSASTSSDITGLYPQAKPSTKTKRTSPLSPFTSTSSKSLWRNDPTHSRSDWQLSITRKSTGVVDTYHIHRMIVGVGPRRSQYLESQFSKLPTTISKRHPVPPSTTRLEMSEGAADLVPILLDYMYNSTSNATEDSFLQDRLKTSIEAFRLYNHAEYFDVSELRLAIANWFRSNLCLAEVQPFLSHIQQFQHSEPLIGVVVEVCANRFGSLTTELAGKLRPWILLQILEVATMQQDYGIKQQKQKHRRHQQHVANLVLGCCQNQRKMERRNFDRLTQRKYLPQLPSSQMAMKFLLLDAEMEDANHGSGDDDGPSAKKLTCLQQRCVRSIATGWSTLGPEFDTQQSFVECLAELNSRILAELLVEVGKSR